MESQKYYITITAISHYGGPEMFRPGMAIELVKEHDNCFDDEAIAVYNEKGRKCGYVANSVDTVARGTYSAGRLYDKFKEETAASILFITPEEAIAEVKIKMK